MFLLCSIWYSPFQYCPQKRLFCLFKNKIKVEYHIYYCHADQNIM